MNRILACLLLSLGTVLVVFGVNSPDSTASISRLFHGAPPDQAVWFLAAGAVAAVLGLASLGRAPKNRPPLPRRGGSTPPQARVRNEIL